MIRLQRIYNFLLFHAIILPVLDVYGLYYALPYYFLGTNLLTESPVQIVVVFSYFSVSQKRNIKQSPKGMKPLGELFLEQT